MQAHTAQRHMNTNLMELRKCQSIKITSETNYFIARLTISESSLLIQTKIQTQQITGINTLELLKILIKTICTGGSSSLKNENKKF